jgi:hypothetical protein
MAFLMGTPAAWPILWKLVNQYPKKFKRGEIPGTLISTAALRVFAGWVRIAGGIKAWFPPGMVIAP